MTEPRIVTPEEAQEVSGPQPTEYVARLAHTVATEPDRTRAAVLAALLTAHERLSDAIDEDPADLLWEFRIAIENGSDY